MKYKRCKTKYKNLKKLNKKDLIKSQAKKAPNLVLKKIYPKKRFRQMKIWNNQIKQLMIYKNNLMINFQSLF